MTVRGPVRATIRNKNMGRDCFEGSNVDNLALSHYRAGVYMGSSTGGNNQQEWEGQRQQERRQEQGNHDIKEGEVFCKTTFAAD